MISGERLKNMFKSFYTIFVFRRSFVKRHKRLKWFRPFFELNVELKIFNISYVSFDKKCGFHILNTKL